MTTIVEGMTPAEFITAVNGNFDSEVTIDATSTVVDIDTGFDSFDEITTGVTKELIAGQTALEFITRLNANFVNTLNNTAKTLIDRFDVELTNTQKRFYSDYYRDKLIPSTYWSKVVAMYVYYQHDEQAAIQNFKADIYNELPYTSPPVFLRFWGIENIGNQFACSLNGGLKPASDPNLSIGSCSIKVHKEENATISTWVYLADGAAGAFIGFSDNSGSADQVYIMNETDSVYNFGNSPVECAFSINDNAVSLFKDGIKVSGPTTITPVGIPDVDLLTGLAQRLTYKIISTRLTDAEQLSLYNDLQWFKNNVQSVF